MPFLRIYLDSRLSYAVMAGLAILNAILVSMVMGVCGDTATGGDLLVLGTPLFDLLKPSILPSTDLEAVDTMYAESLRRLDVSGYVDILLFQCVNNMYIVGLLTSLTLAFIALNIYFGIVSNSIQVYSYLPRMWHIAHILVEASMITIVYTSPTYIILYLEYLPLFEDAFSMAFYPMLAASITFSTLVSIMYLLTGRSELTIIPVLAIFILVPISQDLSFMAYPFMMGSPLEAIAGWDMNRLMLAAVFNIALILASVRVFMRRGLV